MLDQTKNILIGLFVIAACAIVTFMVLFLHPSVGDQGRTLRTRFSNIDKINIGTRVTFAGNPVGEVVDVHEIPAAIDHRKGRDGVVYVYELKLVVDSKIHVYNTDTISARTSGLLGEKSVEITPHPLMPGEILRNVDEEIIFAEETGSMEDAFKELTDVANRLDGALDAVTDSLATMKEHKLVQHLAKTFENLSDVTATIKKEELFVHLADIFLNVSEITSSVNKPKELSETIAYVHNFTGNLNNKWDDIDKTITNVCDCTEHLKKGEGTVGKLIYGDDLYLRCCCLMGKGETLMDDINHYGLLFHLDKCWQRMRARRVNLLSRLCTPQEFRNFFNDEVNQISTSLSRVSMVLDKKSCCPPYNNPCEVVEFQKVFSEFMRRVECLEESLKIYNEQLTDCEVRKTELCQY